MRTRPDHREAVARRLELLRSELDTDASPASEDPAGTSPPRATEAASPSAPTEEPWWEAVPVLELVPPVPDVRDPPLVPVPGRHAARRATVSGVRARLAGLVPETLRGKVRVGPWQLTVLALLVAAGSVVTCWWVLRGDPAVTPVVSGSAAPLVALSAPVATGGPSAGPVGGAASAGSTASASTVTVDVAGKVRRGGVLELPAGSRVVDAIEAAGGARPGADLSGLNRARVLVDGEQIVVGGPAAGAAGVAGSGPAGSSDSAGAGADTGPGALVNLNSATVDELDSLPEVGPVTAQAILDYRTEHGGFGSVDELLDIEGIGEKTLQKIAPHVTV